MFKKLNLVFLLIVLLQPYSAVAIEWDQITKWSGYGFAGVLGIGWYMHMKQLKNKAQDSAILYEASEKELKKIQDQAKKYGFVIDDQGNINAPMRNCSDCAKLKEEIGELQKKIDKKTAENATAAIASQQNISCGNCADLQQQLNEKNEDYTLLESKHKELIWTVKNCIYPNFMGWKHNYERAYEHIERTDKFLKDHNIAIIYDKQGKPICIHRKCGLSKILPVAIPAFKLRDSDCNDERHQKILSLGYSYNEKEKLYVHADKKQSLSIDDHIKLTMRAQKNLISAISLTSDALVLSPENKYHMTKLVRQSVLLAVYFGNKKLPFNAISVHNEIQQKNKL